MTPQFVVPYYDMAALGNEYTPFIIMLQRYKEGDKKTVCQAYTMFSFIWVIHYSLKDKHSEMFTKALAPWVSGIQ